MNCTICGAAEEHFSGEECVEHLKSKLDARTKLVQAMMARLVDLLDDDHFNNMEAMVLDAGVPYPDEEPPTTRRTRDL